MARAANAPFSGSYTPSPLMAQDVIAEVRTRSSWGGAGGSVDQLAQRKAAKKDTARTVSRAAQRRTASSLGQAIHQKVAKKVAPSWDPNLRRVS